MKTTRIKKGQSIEIRMDSSNVFNHPTWDVADQTISSVNFGRITSSFYGRRLIQLSATYKIYSSETQPQTELHFPWRLRTEYSTEIRSAEGAVRQIEISAIG